MINVVSFPGLGLEFTLNSVAFSIFGLDVAWYGVIITTGIILAVAFALTQATSFGIDGDRMLDVVLIGIVCGVVGARVFYIAFDDVKTFADFFDFRGGGLAIYGGIIGAALAVLFGAPWRKVPVLPLLDLTSMGFLIGQSLGRWGNFFNQEAFGSNTTRPWGMISAGTTRYLAAHQAALAEQGIIVDPTMPVHPTFLYESLWCALGFLGLFLYRKHRKFNGEIALLYAIWYGAGRFWIEGLRTDSLIISSLGVPISQLLAATSVLVGLVAWILLRLKHRGQPLVVPEIPPRTAKVTVDGRQVEISWPGGTREPKQEQKLEMAREKLAEMDGPPKDGASEAEADAPNTEVAAPEEPKTAEAGEAEKQAPKSEAVIEADIKEEAENGEDADGGEID